MSSSPLSFNLTRSFGILLALLLFLVAFSMFNFRSLSDANNLNIHTYQIINGTLELETTLTAIDAGVRGFLVAGEATALRAYRANLRAYDRRFAELRASTSDNRAQVANFAELEARQRKWVAQILDPLVARSQKIADPQQRVAVASESSLQRRTALRELQSVTRHIVEIEEQLLEQRTQNQKNVYWWTRFTLIAGSGFSILLTGFLVSFASRSARQLHQSNTLLGEAKTRAEATNTQLLQTNARLESEIAARRLADEKLRRSVLDLQRSNAELEQFAYVASHDLQEPLRAVGGCVQVLQRRYEGKLDARADQFIQHAVDGAQRMQTLINDLLAYSRVGTRTQKLEAVEGASIVQSALQSVSVARAESGAQITVDPLPVLICDAGQIEQVLQNLVSNALKFRGETAPRIHIGYAAPSQGSAPSKGSAPSQGSAPSKGSAPGEGSARFHVLSVEDDGVGIEPQYFERIFVMFQRLHTRAEFSGTGIGLAICKKIVERHGGKIWVESWHQTSQNPPICETGEPVAAKHGTKFSFSLPFEPEPEMEPETEPQTETAPEALSAL